MYKASTLWVTFPEPECVVPKFYWVNIWISYSLSTILNPYVLGLKDLLCVKFFAFCNSVLLSST